MTASEQKRVGRPPKQAAERRRLNRTFRVTDAMNERLEAAALANQRSVSEEIEHRLERSFWEDRLRTLVVEAVREAKG